MRDYLTEIQTIQEILSLSFTEEEVITGLVNKRILNYPAKPSIPIWDTGDFYNAINTMLSQKEYIVKEILSKLVSNTKIPDETGKKTNEYLRYIFKDNDSESNFESLQKKIRNDIWTDEKSTGYFIEDILLPIELNLTLSSPGILSDLEKLISQFNLAYTEETATLINKPGQVKFDPEKHNLYARWKSALPHETIIGVKYPGIKAISDNRLLRKASVVVSFGY